MSIEMACPICGGRTRILRDYVRECVSDECGIEIEGHSYTAEGVLLPPSEAFHSTDEESDEWINKVQDLIHRLKKMSVYTINTGSRRSVCELSVEDRDLILDITEEYMAML